MSLTIDLNADLGESFGAWSMGDDAAMLDLVTSANVACGFHGGDPLVMSQTVKLCKDKGVKIGAHPGFDDLRGFGRRRILGIKVDELSALLIYQIGALKGMAASEGAKVTHVKIHGALSNMASEEQKLAADCIAAFKKADPALVAVVLAGTHLETEAAKAGLPLAREIFADRAYNDDGTLVQRGTPGAMIEDANQAAERVLKMLEEETVTTITGKTIPLKADTVCVHGDSPGAVKMAETLRVRLEKAGVMINSFV